LVGLEKEFSSYKNPDNDKRGDWVAGDLTVGMTASMRPNQAYDLVDPITGNIFPYNPNRVWAYIPESMDKLIQDGCVLFPNDTDRRPMMKRFRSNLKDTHNPISTLLSGVGLNTESTRQIQSIFGGSYFEYSKPVSLIKALISQVKIEKNDVVLDFFSGSGVLAHGILELISEDKVDCNFVLVQLPEQFKKSSEAYKAGYKKLSDLCIDRVKRIIEGFGENPKPIDAGFNVFTLTKSHFPRVDFSPDPELTDEENLKSLEQYIKEKESQLTGLFEPKDILDEVLLKNGFKLSYSLEDQPQFKKNTIWLADDHEKSSLICLDQKLHTDTVGALLAEPTEFICLEQALTTDDKWNLRKHLAHKFIAF